MLIELPGFASGKLDAASCATVRAHLQSCTACRTELAEIRKLDELLTRALPAIVPSPTFESTFANRLAAEAAAEEEASRHGWVGWLLQPWLIPAIAAALVAAVMVPPWFSERGSPSPSLSMPHILGKGPVASSKKPAEPKVASNAPAEKNAQVAAPPSDVLQRPELFVDYSVIRDLDILESGKGDTESHTG